MYDPNGVFNLLQPLGVGGCYAFFDDERCGLYVPVEGAPKGSARAIPRLGTCPATGTRSHYQGMSFVPGSGDSTAKKQRVMEKAIREAITRLWQMGFVPYDGHCRLDLDVVFLSPKVRRTEEHHTTYPDRDKLLRAAQDYISPPKKDKKPQMDVPHLVVNDSMIHGGYSEKWWLHTWNRITDLKDDGDGIYMVLHY